MTCDGCVFLSFNLKIDSILRVCHMIKKLNLHFVYVLSFFKNLLLSTSFALQKGIRIPSLGSMKESHKENMRPQLTVRCRTLVPSKTSSTETLTRMLFQSWTTPRSALSPINQPDYTLQQKPTSLRTIIKLQPTTSSSDLSLAPVARIFMKQLKPLPNT